MKLVRAAATAAAIVVPAVSPAADKLLIAPPAAWVRPLAVPKDDGVSDGAAVRVILQDQQIDFEKDATTSFGEVMMRIQTPQGLGAGNLSIPWNPETDTLTVHKLHVIRDGKVIDVLAKQSFTILRRETNLENAMLDGVLTANIQPEGLQVGDVIDIATSQKHSDPAVIGHDERLAVELGGVPVGRVRIRARWPSGLPTRWRQTDDLPPLVEHREGGFTSVEVSADDLKPVALPNNAPPRFGIARQVQFTDFASWTDMSARFEPLYARAATISPQGTLRREVDRIAASSTDPRKRAEAALALVQNQVRYVYLGLNDGGLMPATAETTWSRRFGDCKGKTVLLMALLAGLGIEADPVLVNATAGDGMDARLPMIASFNHILVRARIDGRTYWLDGTRLGDNRLDDILVPAFIWGLPLVPNGTPLVAIKQPPLAQPNTTTDVRLDASAGIDKPAAAHIETVYHGDIATLTHLRLDNLTADGRDRALREFWRGQYAFVNPTRVTATYDAASGEERLVLDGNANMDWTNGGYETDGTLVGYVANFTRDPGPHADAPFAVDYPSFTIDREIIILPNQGKGFTLDSANLDRTVAGIEYRRRGSIANGIVSLERQVRAIQPEFPASDAPAAQEALRVLGRTAVYVRPPSSDAEETTETAATTASSSAAPETAADWIAAGNAYLRQDRRMEAAAAYEKATLLDPHSYLVFCLLAAVQLQLGKADLAMASVDKAISLNPKASQALSLRGTIRLATGQRDLALQDFTSALDDDPLEPSALSSRGSIESMNGSYRAALIDYTMALQVVPKSWLFHVRRAETFLAMRDMRRAHIDADAAMALQPGNPDIYVLVANIFDREGNREQGVAQAAAMVAAAPQNDYAHVCAGVVYAHFNRRDDAFREFSKALAIKPSEAAYLNRANLWPRDDIAHREADIRSAAKLAPESIFVLREQVDLAEQKKDYAGAITSRSALIRMQPDPSLDIVMRGIDHARSGQAALAEQDYRLARTKATTAAALNNACFEMAKANEMLTTALDECDDALRKQPEAIDILDSRAFVLLPLGRNAEAVATYDRILARTPTLATSLYGRAIVELRMGATAQAAADRTAALKVDPEIARTFAGYGIQR